MKYVLSKLHKFDRSSCQNAIQILLKIEEALECSICFSRHLVPVTYVNLLMVRSSKY